jgi:hypothetical protein
VRIPKASAKTEWSLCDFAGSAFEGWHRTEKIRARPR